MGEFYAKKGLSVNDGSNGVHLRSVRESLDAMTHHKLTIFDLLQISINPLSAHKQHFAFEGNRSKHNGKR